MIKWDSPRNNAEGAITKNQALTFVPALANPDQVEDSSWKFSSFLAIKVYE